jgi:hypothetical protein
VKRTGGVPTPQPLEALRRVAEERDFVHLRRFDYSLTKLMERYPDGCPDDVIAAALMIPEHEVEMLYQASIVKLRALMRVDD